MLKMSPFLTFLLYCLFVGFTVYYLTKDRLDEKSRYILVGVLILPYIFMDQFAHFSNVDTNQNVDISTFKYNKEPERYTNTLPPNIELKDSEKVENLKIVEEIKNKQKSLEAFAPVVKEDTNKKLYTLEEVQKLLNATKNQNVTVEKYGSMYNGNPPSEYNETNTFTSQLLKPLGENGNGFTNAWDHDYILLNTDKWGPALNPPPVCKTEKSCPVCPNLTTGYPLMLRDFDSTRRITPPINADTPSMNA